MNPRQKLFISESDLHCIKTMHDDLLRIWICEINELGWERAKGLLKLLNETNDNYDNNTN